MKKRTIFGFTLLLVVLYCSIYLYKRINLEMVGNKFGNEIRCQLKPSVDGPSVFLIQASIEGSELSKEQKKIEMKKQMGEIVAHYAEIEQKNNFNRKVFWILRNIEELGWDLVTKTN